MKLYYMTLLFMSLSLYAQNMYEKEIESVEDIIKKEVQLDESLEKLKRIESEVSSNEILYFKTQELMARIYLLKKDTVSYISTIGKYVGNKSFDHTFDELDSWSNRGDTSHIHSAKARYCKVIATYYLQKRIMPDSVFKYLELNRVEYQETKYIRCGRGFTAHDLNEKLAYAQYYEFIDEPDSVFTNLFPIIFDKKLCSLL